MKKFLTLIAIVSMLATTDSNCDTSYEDPNAYYSYNDDNTNVIYTRKGAWGVVRLHNKVNENIILKQGSNSITLKPDETSVQKLRTLFGQTSNILGLNYYTISCSNEKGSQLNCNHYIQLVPDCNIDKENNCKTNNDLGMG